MNFMQVPNQIGRWTPDLLPVRFCSLNSGRSAVVAVPPPDALLVSALAPLLGAGRGLVPGAAKLHFDLTVGGREAAAFNFWDGRELVAAGIAITSGEMAAAAWHFLRDQASNQLQCELPAVELPEEGTCVTLFTLPRSTPVSLWDAWAAQRFLRALPFLLATAPAANQTE
jgi:hypothetical protein